MGGPLLFINRSALEDVVPRVPADRMTDAMQPATTSDSPSRTLAGRWLTRERLLATLPFVIAAVALLLRLQGIDWDGGAFYHPDERSIYLRAEASQLIVTASGLDFDWLYY